MNKSIMLLSIGLMAFLNASAAQAQMFKGKVITMIINYGAGGNADTEGRIFERHLGKHLEGKPGIIVQNVPGAGGLTAVNQMGMGIGVRDPNLTLGFFTFNPIAVLIEDPGLRVKVETFPLVAGLGAYYVAYGRKDSLPGERRPQDIARAKDINAAGYARNSSHDIRLRLMFEIMGTGHKVVTGFQSISAVNVAIEQNEINFMVSTTPGYETQAYPNLIQRGIAMPFWQLSALTPEGKLVGSEKLTSQGIKFFEEVYEQAHGKKPSGPKYQALKVTDNLSAQLARIVAMPPNASREAVEEIRRAFHALQSDKDFLDEYVRVIKMEPVMISGADAQKSLNDSLKTAVSAVKSILREAGGMNE